MKFAKWILVLAGMVGMISLFPLYFKEHTIAPDLMYPVFYYGFISINIIWQLMYIYISHDPVKFRPIIFFGFMVKIIGAISIFFLIIQDRAEYWWIAIALVDFIFSILFLVSFFVLKKCEK